MTATIIDGRAVAERLRARIAARTAELARQALVPGLAVVLVGDDPASQVYVGSKTKQAAAAGLKHFDHRLPASTGTSELIALVEKLNAQTDVHGILVQLPLPAGVDSAAVLAAIDPAKDVDGFHAVNAGRLALVVGRSNIVGKPMAQLLLQNDRTVTIAHARTRDLPQLCREAEILVAAIGRPKAIAGDWIRPGAIVIDVGINRIAGADGTNKLVGDVDYQAALAHAGAITPVPGGVGPMTIACLLMNTVNAAIRSCFGAQADLLSAP